MTGPAGFEVGEDTVAAKLSVEVSQKSLEDLHQVTQRVSMLKAELEGATRAQGTFLDYLNQLPDIQERATQAQRSFVSQLERGSLIQQEIAGTTGGARNLAPHGYNDPWSGLSEGLGLGPRGTAASPEEVQQNLQNLTPRQVANMRAERGSAATPEDIEQILDERGTDGGAGRGRGRRRGSSEEEDDTRGSGGGWQDNSLSQNERLSDLRGQVLNEVQGRNYGAAARLGAQGLGSVLGGSKFATGAKVLGAGGLVVGGAIAANNAVQNVGEMYQGFKNQGLVQGGGAAEGLAQEVQSYTMALSPFLNLEQSRQIVQQGLTEGYRGKQFETITQMVASNTKEMAMDIGMSFATIRKQVIEGGQSMEGYAAQQELTKQLAAGSTTKSLPELQQEIAGFQGSLIDMGTPGAAAGQIASQIAVSFPDDADMKSVTTGIEQAISTGPDSGLLQQIMIYARKQGEKFPPRTFAEQIPGLLGPDKFQKYLWGYLKSIAQRYKGNSALFHRYLQSVGIQMSPNSSKKLQEQLLSGVDPAAQGKREMTENAGKIEDRGVGGGGLFDAGDLYGTLGGQDPSEGPLAKFGSGLWDMAQGKWGEGWDKWQEAAGAGVSPHGRYSMPVMDTINEQYGKENIEIVDTEGNTHEYDPNDDSQREGLSKGDWRWRKKGDQSGGYTLAEAGAAAENYKDGSNGQTTNVEGSVTIDLTPEAKRVLQSPNSVHLSPNQERANSGYGDSTPNNPPPGDHPRSGWGR